MQEIVSTGDIYESVYYVLNGCKLEIIEGVPVNGKISCLLKFTGEDIARLQIEYFQGKAIVNLFAFRRTYSQVNSWINTAKKQLKHELLVKEQKKEKEEKKEADISKEGGAV